MTREEAIDKLQDLWNEVYNEDSDGYDYAVAIDMAIEALHREEAEENGWCHRIKPKEYLPSERTGEWLEVEVFHEVYDIEGVNTWGSEMQCDQCGFRHTAIEGHMVQYNFCPNCGAKMTKGGDSE